MLLKRTLLLLFFTFISNIIFGQAELYKRKNIYFEIAGSGGFGSINYEKIFYKKNITELAWRAGFSLAPTDKNNGTGMIFPLMINSIIGKNKNKFELGLGQGITITTKGNFFILTTAAIGYRYQSETKNLFYRITYTPLISYVFDFQIQHWGGVSIGYTLKNKAK